MNKYRNKIVVVDGIKFHSKKEAHRWCELKLLERAGKISDLRRQVKFELVPKQDGESACNYVADFVYLNENGETVVEDCKGVRTDAYIIKRKIFQWRYDMKIKET